MSSEGRFDDDEVDTKPSWKFIRAGPKAPHWKDDFSVKRLVETKEAMKACRWPNETTYKVKQQSDRVASLSMAGTDSLFLTKMLKYNQADTEQLSRRTREDMTENFDCTLSEIQGTGADHIVMSLRNPVDRILSGISESLHFRTSDWQSKEENEARKAFYENFNSSNEYLDALRSSVDPDPDDGTTHRKAMAVTHCHHCNDFMLPVEGYYLKPSDDAKRKEATDPAVKFVCDCANINEVLIGIGSGWGLSQDELRGVDKTSYNMGEWNTLYLSVSEENRRWIEETYAADVALYEEHCGQLCNHQPRKFWGSDLIRLP